jgi:D-ribose pyranose/furanose isomerase RbsD
MSGSPDGAILDWVSEMTGISRSDLEKGFSQAKPQSAPATGSAAQQTKNAAPVASKKTAKPAQKPVKMSGEKIDANMSQLEERFRRVTGQIMHTVEINALLLGAGIESACIDFKQYADEKIEKMKRAEEMDKLALEILEVCTTAVSGGFAAVMIEGEIATEVFKTLAEGTIKVVKAKAEPNASGDFIKFVDSMIAGAKQAGHDAGTAAIDIVRREIRAAEKAVRDAPDTHVSVSDSKEYKFVEHFLFAESSHFDQLVARHVGIPTPEMVNKVQIKMTGDMIRRFAEKLVRANESGVDNVVIDDAPYLANHAANDAMAKLKKKHGFRYED